MYKKMQMQIPILDKKQKLYIMTAIQPSQSTPSTGQGSTQSFSIDSNLINQIRDNASQTTVVTESNQAQVTQDQGVLLVTNIKNDHQFSTERDAFVALAIICQKGGTSKRANGNIYAVVNGKRLTLALIRETMSKIKYKHTLRQWARSYATQIANVCELFDIPGDLYKKIARKHPDVNATQSYWLSNFQMDNVDCEESLRNYIKEHFTELFPNS